MKKEECIRTNASAEKMTPFLEIPSPPTSEPESLGTSLPLPPFDNRISECSEESLEPPPLIDASILKNGDVGKKQKKRISRAERRREVRKSLADGTINPFLLRPRHLPYPPTKHLPLF